MPKVLITGISGGLGQLVASRLADRYEVIGIDRAPWEGHPTNITFHCVDLLKRGLEEVFRNERPKAVVHLGLIRHFRADPEKRHQLNLNGTKRLLEFAAKYEVERFVLSSSSYVYGALPENPYFIEEEAPLNASRTYPEMRDLAEVDTLCLAHLWKHPEMATAILRPVNTLGPHVRSAIGTYLELPVVPTILGFNPMAQFIHEDDLAAAIALALDRELRGVFNVAGSGEVPLGVAIRETGGSSIAIPEFLARISFEQLFNLGLLHTPSAAIDFLKYPCTVSGKRFVAATGFDPEYTLQQTFQSVRRPD